MKLHDWDVRDKIRVDVSEGEIAISSVWVSVATESLIVIDIDCKSKYPVIGPISSNQICLIADEDTLFARNSDAPTILSFQLPDGFEIGPIEKGRYNISIFCYDRRLRYHDASSVMVWECK